MKHLGTIQTEFLKEARKWDDMSLEDQRGYLKRHPKSKRRLTSKQDLGKQDSLQKSLDAVVKMTWSGDVSTKEAIANANLSANDVETMKNAVHENIKFFKREGGVPFVGDNKKYDKLVKENKGLKLLQKLIDASD